MWTSAHCAVQSALREALAEQPTCEQKCSSAIPWAVSPQKTSCMPAGVPLPSFPSVSPFLQLPPFTKLPNEGICHLYTSSVSCPPPVTFTFSASSSLEPAYSDSAASSSGCCWVDRERERRRKHRETCLHSYQDSQGVGGWDTKGSEVKRIRGRKYTCETKQKKKERYSKMERKDEWWKEIKMGAVSVQSGLWGYETSSGNIPQPQLSHGEKTKT